MLQHIKHKINTFIDTIFSRPLDLIKRVSHYIFLWLLLSFGVSAVLYAHTIEMQDCGNFTQKVKKDSLYYALSGYVRDSELLSIFDDAVLVPTFISIPPDILKRKRLSSYETFARVLTRDNKKNLVKEREAFRDFVISYWYPFYTLQEAQNLHEYVRSALGQKEVQAEREFNRKVVELFFLFAKTGKVPQLPPFALSSKNSKADMQRKSLLELIDLKREEPMLDLALMDLDTIISKEFGLSKIEARSRIENLKTVIIEYSLNIKAKYYTQTDIDSLIAFYRSPLGAKSVLLTLQASSCHTFEKESMRYMNDVLLNVTQYLGH